MNIKAFIVMPYLNSSEQITVFKMMTLDSGNPILTVKYFCRKLSEV